jgi:hypothetical protein
MRIHNTILAKALALALPLFLAGCGGDAAPIDPCTKLEKKIKGKDINDARDRASYFIERRKKAIARKFQSKIKFGTPTVTCAKPEVPAAAPAKAKKATTDDPWATKKKEKPKQAFCEVVLPYCAVK